MSKHKLGDGDTALQDDETSDKQMKQQLISHAQSEIVTIPISSDKVAYHVHKDLIAARSPYFATLLKDQWNKDEKNQFELLSFRTCLFKFIFEWLYTGTISVEPSGPFEESKISWPDWIELYHYADFLMISDLANLMVNMDLKNACFRLSQAPKYAIYWYRYELQHTPYYQLFLDEYVRYMENHAWDEEEAKQFEEDVKAMVKYPELLSDLMLRMGRYKVRPWQYVSEYDRCRYHIHVDGERCEGVVDKANDNKFGNAVVKTKVEDDYNTDDDE